MIDVEKLQEKLDKSEKVRNASFSRFSKFCYNFTYLFFFRCELQQTAS